MKIRVTAHRTIKDKKQRLKQIKHNPCHFTDWFIKLQAMVEHHLIQTKNTNLKNTTSVCFLFLCCKKNDISIYLTSCITCFY